LLPITQPNNIDQSTVFFCTKNIQQIYLGAAPQKSKKFEQWNIYSLNDGTFMKRNVKTIFLLIYFFYYVYIFICHQTERQIKEVTI